MSIASLLGEDEHTGGDDAYSRIMKARKWVIFSALLAIVYGHGFATAQQFSIGVARIDIADWAWSQAIFGTMAYSGVQYGLLLWQLGQRYDRIMKERLKDRWREEMEERHEKYRELNAKYFQVRRDLQEEAEVQSGNVEIRQAELENLLIELREMNDALRFARARGPEYSISFRVAELLIDAMRVVTPLVAWWLGLLALIKGLT